MAHHVIRSRQICVKVMQHAVWWILHHCSHIEQIEVYLTQEASSDNLLHVLSASKMKDNVQVFGTPLQVNRQDNLFRYWRLWLIPYYYC